VPILYAAGKTPVTWPCIVFSLTCRVLVLGPLSLMTYTAAGPIAFSDMVSACISHPEILVWYAEIALRDPGRLTTCLV